MSALRDFLPATTEPEEFEPAVEAALELEQAARVLGLEESVLTRLRLPERESRVYLPETAFRVQHSTALGPSLGPVDWRPEASLSELRAAAMAQTWQSALLGLPLGGAAGAILCDPAKVNERGIKSLAQRYVTFLDLRHDLLTPGDDCHPTVLGWMSRRAEPGIVLGLAPELGGPPPDLRPTALGAFLLLERILEERRQPLREQRIAIQGFGRTGQALAEQLYRAGARIVALSDISGALYNDSGLDVPQVSAYAAQHHRLLGCLQGEGITNLDLLEAPCDVLVLAAAARQVNLRVAMKIQAPIVIEVAEQAICPPAAKVLDDQDRLVIPSLLARGGASVAFFQEWMERARGATPCTFDGSRIIHAWENSRSQAQHFKVPLRLGVMIAAVGRVAAAVRLN